MAMLFMDSFDHYATADIGAKWTTNTSGSIVAAGRNSTSCLRITDQGKFVRKAIPSGKATLVVGAAFRVTLLPTTGDAIVLVFQDAGSSQFGVYLTIGGRLKVSGGAVSSTGATTISTGVFYYIELKVTINNSTGSYELRVNGATELSGSGLDTQTTANATADQLLLSGAGAVGVINSNYDYDDLYWLDNSGTVNNDFLGDIRVQAILPDGAGGNTQWTPLSGSNYANVNEATPDGDTTYNSDATIGDRDTYTYGNLSPSTATIKAVQIMTYARKDDAGTRTIAPVVRIGGVNYDQASLPNLTTSYQYLPQILETSPATSVGWTLSEVNGAEFGQKVIA